MMNTPVLLIAWRRTDTLRQVINALRPVAPSRLFVACDGPNPERPGEADKVAATRAVIENEIDWPCQIERFYSDVNQGCRLGVSRAITWFFQQVQEGIILEDDVVPHPEFFEYCAYCLERYRHDVRVWAISAHHSPAAQRIASQITNKPVHLRYNFNCWGWASWSDRWSSYSSKLDIAWFDSNRSSILSFCGTKAGREIIKRAWQASTGKIDTWDYQANAVQASCLSFSVHPSISLVYNVGFGNDATHTTGTAPRGTVSSQSSYGRANWLHEFRGFMEVYPGVPPFIREVGDASYSKPRFETRLLNLMRSAIKSLIKAKQ